MMINELDLRSPSFLIDGVQDALARSKALVSAAVVLMMNNDGMDFVTGDNSFKYDRLIYQLEAIEMLIDKYQELFSDVEIKLMRLEFTEKSAAPDLANAA
ncbi:MAG: hypothetical protein BVN35_20370 [Proteobacteria bacterium ST_bin11]|nr:MAG: hypothetical protein BVN35_20370 [Proteobacteria bacterium ST_bin11]